MNTPRRQLRIIAIGAALALTAALLITPAYADGGSSGAAALGPFDLTDSHAIKVSQYQLSLDDGGAFSPLQTVFYSVLSFTWDSYRFWVGFIAYVVDWATSLTWVSWITGPMHAAEQSIREQVLQPLNLTSISQTGVMGLLLILAGAAAAVHMLKGATGRGLVEALSSAAAAALAVGLLSSPVLLFAGDGTDLAMPLRVAQRTGVELSNVVTGGGVSNGNSTSATEVNAGDGVGGAGTMITETLIRPVHQMFNYGEVLDVHATPCVGVYDNVLKAGPYKDGADEARDAVGDCDKALKTYADDSSWTRLIGLGIYGFTAAVLGVLVLVFVVLLMMAVLTLTWASLKLLIHAPMAILPGDSRGPGLRDLVDVLSSLISLVAHLVLLSVVVRLIRGILTATATVPLQVRFVGIDLLLLASTGLLIASHINQRRGAKSFAQRLRDRLKMSAGKERSRFAAKAGQWLAQPSYGATYGQLGGGMRRPGGGGGGIRTLNRVTASNGFRMAATAGRLGAGAVTGGSALVVASAVQTGHAAAVTGLAAGRASQAGYRVLQTGYRVHDSLRHGAQRATTGRERIDRVLAHTARAHNYVEAETKRAAVRTATQVVTTAGPRRPPVGDGRSGYHAVARANSKALPARPSRPRSTERAIRPSAPNPPTSPAQQGPTTTMPSAGARTRVVTTEPKLTPGPSGPRATPSPRTPATAPQPPIPRPGRAPTPAPRPSSAPGAAPPGGGLRNP